MDAMVSEVRGTTEDGWRGQGDGYSGSRVERKGFEKVCDQLVPHEICGKRLKQGVVGSERWA